MNESAIIIIGFAVVFALMIICKVVYNLIAKAADEQKDRRDRASGAYQESRQENLSDRFK